MALGLIVKTGRILTAKLLLGQAVDGITHCAIGDGDASFTDPQRDLPPIDRLEDFRPGGHSMYQRVMVAVLCGRTSIPGWTYWMSCPPYAERVASGQGLRP